MNKLHKLLKVVLNKIVFLLNLVMKPIAHEKHLFKKKTI